MEEKVLEGDLIQLDDLQNKSEKEKDKSTLEINGNQMTGKYDTILKVIRTWEQAQDKKTSNLKICNVSQTLSAKNNGADAVPLLKTTVKIGNKEYEMIIDTGAQVSVLPSSVYLENKNFLLNRFNIKLQKSDIELVWITNNTKRTEGIADIPIQIGRIRSWCRFLVTPNIDIGILGLNFLIRNDFMLMMKGGKECIVYLNNQRIKIVDQSKQICNIKIATIEKRDFHESLNDPDLDIQKESDLTGPLGSAIHF